MLSIFMTKNSISSCWLLSRNTPMLEIADVSVIPTLSLLSRGKVGKMRKKNLQDSRGRRYRLASKDRWNLFSYRLEGVISGLWFENQGERGKS